MPQQINLYNPILLIKKHYFSALTMLQAWGVFLFFGSCLCIYWVWNINVASDAFKKTLSSQARELVNLQTAVKQNKSGVGSVDFILKQELQSLHADLQLREKLQSKLQKGLFQRGQGHAARLLLVAQSIPAQAWLTEIKSDETQLEVSGFTLEPLVLNDWVGKLSGSPLLAGQKLTTLKVEKINDSKLKTVSTSVPIWSFDLVSAVENSAVIAGAKP